MTDVPEIVGLERADECTAQIYPVQHLKALRYVQ